MKVAKSYKIIFLILAFIMSTMLALGVMKPSNVYADSKVSASTYFVMTDGETVTSASFGTAGLQVEPRDKVKFSLKNNLIVNDMSMKMKLSKGFTTSVEITLTSFYVNGNPKEWSKWESDKISGTDFDKQIVNTLKLGYDENAKVVGSLNGVEIGQEFAVDANGFVVIEFGIVNNFFTVNGIDVSANYSSEDAKIYYKVKNVDDRALSSKISIGFEKIEDAAMQDNDFILEYIDQLTDSDPETNDYKQSFIIAEGQTKLTPAKKQRVYLSEAFYLKKDDGTYTLTKKTNEIYSLSFKGCPVIDSSASLCLVNPDNKYNVELETGTTIPNEILFNKGSDGSFGVGAKVSGKYEVFEEFIVDDLKVTNYNDGINVQNYKDEEAPKYVFNDVAYASFLNALKQEYTVEKDNEETPEIGDKTTTSAGLGTTLNIPSMKDLVFDNFDSYEDLTTKVYYRNQIESVNTQLMEFNLNKIGDYMFFVVFGDDAGNTMYEKDFIVADGDDVAKGIYGDNFVFGFEIEDNADIIVKAPEVQGEGYKGVQYRASKFIIDAEGCRKTYKLFYNKNINADADDANWIEIPQASISEEGYKANGFSYDEVKKVNYDGELKFVPTRFGAYKIECTATSAVSSRYATNSTIIKVNSEVNTVKVPSKWLENNIWSVVFLSVGTLSLIGIIVLLCIKPKEQTDND